MNMHHANDRQNTKKHSKMERRLRRGVLLPGSKNTGESHTSKIHPLCKWFQKRIATQARMEPT